MRFALLASVPAALLFLSACSALRCDAYDDTDTYTITESLIEAALEEGELRADVTCEALCDAAIRRGGGGEYDSFDSCAADFDDEMNADPDADIGDLGCEGRVQPYCE